MPTTPNFNLPLIEGNQTADIVRDLNALAEAVDESVSQNIQEIENENLNKIGDLSNLQTTTKDNLVDAVNEVQQEINAHSANYISHIPYAVASGSANTYTVTLNPAPSAYVEGMAISVKINVQNTGASTINVNGLGAKPIKKANGNDVSSGNLKAGSIYTFRYNGSVFILQGEGGAEGNVTPDKVLSGVTYTDPSTGNLTNGTMANNGAVNQTITTQGGQYTIPQGYHDGSGRVTANFANLTAGNIRKDVNVGGVVGTLEPLVSVELAYSSILSTGSARTATIMNGEIYVLDYAGPGSANIFRRRYTLSGTLIEQTTIFTFPAGSNTGVAYTNSPEGVYLRYFLTNDCRYVHIDWNGTIIIQNTSNTSIGINIEYLFTNRNMLFTTADGRTFQLKDQAGTILYEWTVPDPYSLVFHLASFKHGNRCYKGIIVFDSSFSTRATYWIYCDGSRLMNFASGTLSSNVTNKIIGLLARPY